ncbi:MAG: DUF512 domain-containing protein, partial [Coriobacteriia bacterium]|nr:DUF512 domain-containing protein [Coriobacteriia bacterium]
LSTSEDLTIVCGELLTHTWLGVLSSVHAGDKLRLLPVRNRFFGGNVSVTGLLTAADIIRATDFDLKQLADSDPAAAQRHRYLIPDDIFNDEGLTLDDYTADQLADTAAGQLLFYQADISGLLQTLDTHMQEDTD